MSVNQWATNEEKQDEDKCGPFEKLSEQGEQRCSEPSVVCLGDTEDSQKDVHPAFPLPTTALSALQGALKDGFGEAAVS